MIKKFIHYIEQSSSNSFVTSITVMTHKGNFFWALSVKTISEKIWIVDSGAFDYMINNFNLFKIFKDIYENLSVNISDGSLSKVKGIWEVVISDNLTLKSVIFIHNPSCNLLFVNKIIEWLISLPIYVFSGIRNLGWRLAILRIFGLYLLKINSIVDKSTRGGFHISAQNKDGYVMTS